MTIKQELIYYAKGCINGKIISCTKHKQACQRFLDDLERAKSKDCPFIWNESEAQKIVKWFSYPKHSKGDIRLAETWHEIQTVQQSLYAESP